MRYNLHSKLNPTFCLESGINQEENIITKSFEKDITNLQETMQLNSHRMIESIVSTIKNAKTISIIVHHSSYSIASYMYAILEPILGNVTLVNTIERMHTEYLLRMTKDNVLISISFPRYHSETVEFTELASKQNVQLVALTDSMVSPLIEYTEKYLLSKFDSMNCHNSNLSALALINAISDSLTSELAEKINKKIKRIKLNL